MVGAIDIQVLEDTITNANTSFFTDFGYFNTMNKHLFNECKHFIILRHVDGGGGHFDYFLGQRTHTGIFKCNSVEAEYVLSLCNEEYRRMLTGEGAFK